MSMNLMAQAMSIKVGNPLRKLVLIKMADNANDEGECWPSYQHIADHCECSKSAVKAHTLTGRLWWPSVSSVPSFKRVVWKRLKSEMIANAMIMIRINRGGRGKLQTLCSE